MVKPLLMAIISLCSGLSLILLIAMIFTPPGSLWAFVLLLQVISSYCGYRLYKSKAFDLQQIYEYLKNTKL